RIDAACAALLATLVVACAPDKTLGPNGEHIIIVPATTETQFGNPGAELGKPLVFYTRDQQWGTPMRGTPVQWQIVQGYGAQLLNASTVSDANGVVSARLQFGQAPGVYIVQVTLSGGGSAAIAA